ncbi:MAG: hypothetical protein CMJ83_10695 [Planctomycetes bacterium]|nr:hypothetical protein [Planctomycetota bacterium]
MAPKQPTPQADELPELPGYEVLEVLGKGGQACVYRARQKSLNRIVAIKVLAPEHSDDRSKRRRFLAEARLQSKLHHPNILQGIDINSHEGLWYFVMEFVSGRNLHMVLVEEAQLSEKKTLDTARQVSEALAHAFERGIVHGDIKPENLVLSHDGTVKMVDFGIARLAREQKHGGKVMGTEEFMAPEVKSGKSTGDIRSDIFSLGLTLWELLTGALPPVAQCQAKLGPDVRKWEPSLLKSTGAIVARCLALDPAHRYQTPRELMQAIEGTNTSEPVAVKGTASRRSGLASSPAVDARPKKSAALPVAAAAVLVALGLGLWATFSSGSNEEKGEPPVAVLPQPDPPSIDPPKPDPPLGNGSTEPVKPTPPPVKPTTDPPIEVPPTKPVVPPTARPELVFDPPRGKVSEGTSLTVRVSAKNLPADFRPTFKVLDDEGRDISANMPMPKAAPDGDDPQTIVMTWNAPWFNGHHEVSMFILVSQPPLQERLAVGITDRNRSPELVRAGPRRVHVEEGADPIAIAIAGTDPDGDPVDLELVETPKTVEATISDGRLLLRAKDRPGKQSGAPETIVVRGLDTHGGSATTEIEAVLQDVDHPATVTWDMGDGSWEIHEPLLPGGTIVLRGPERPNLNVRIRVADPDLPDSPFKVTLPVGTPRIPGLALKVMDGGDTRIVWRLPPRHGYGPISIELDVLAGNVLLRKLRLRIHTLRRTAPPPQSSRDPLDRALEWLRRHQLKDGSFPMRATDFEVFSEDPKDGGAGNRRYRTGVTALAVLAALRSGDGSPWVRRALDFILSSQGSDGRLGGSSTSQTYDHMIASEALMFGWHLLGDAKFHIAGKKAVRWIVDARNPGAAGAWRYGARSGESDTSVTVWAIRALHAAHMAGFKVPSEALHGGFSFIDSMIGDDGRIGYQTTGGVTTRNGQNQRRHLPKLSESMTAAGLSVLIFAPGKKASDRRFKKGLVLLFESPPAWSFRSLPGSHHHEKLTFAEKRQYKKYSPVDFYYWQHGTFLFRSWKRAFGNTVHNNSQWRAFPQFAAAQQRKSGDAKGSFNPDTTPWGYAGGRSYATAIMALAMTNASFTDAFVGEVFE